MSDYMTVQELRQNGFKVQVHYARYLAYVDYDSGRHEPDNGVTPYSPHKGFVDVGMGKIGYWKEPIFPRGGECEVTVTTPDNQTLVGKSVCSLLDNFDRKLGLKIALGRAFKQKEAPHA